MISVYIRSLPHPDYTILDKLSPKLRQFYSTRSA